MSRVMPPFRHPTTPPRPEATGSVKEMIKWMWSGMIIWSATWTAGRRVGRRRMFSAAISPASERLTPAGVTFPKSGSR